MTMMICSHLDFIGLDIRAIYLLPILHEKPVSHVGDGLVLII
jgi:hypothetical protein